MAPKSSPPKPFASTAGQPIKIFCDVNTPRRSGPSALNADFYDSNDENIPRVPTLKLIDKDTKAKPEPPANRAPLADVTQETVGRPRSLSAALVEIVMLEEALEAAQKQNQWLKGDIVAYQDALHQADADVYL